MSIVYEFEVTALCPIDDTRDEYAATFRTDVQINVERIMLHAESFAHAVIFQEALTKELHRLLGVDGQLTTVGTHSGVRTTVTVES